jgi:hypothetical protein
MRPQAMVFTDNPDDLWFLYPLDESLMHEIRGIEAKAGLKFGYRPVSILTLEKYHVPNPLGRAAITAQSPVNSWASAYPGAALDAQRKSGGVNGSMNLSPGPVRSDKGGIDFRSLLIMTQPMPSFAFKPVNLAVNQAGLNGPDRDWQEIRAMVEGGIIPSYQRIKEYLEASCKSKDCSQRIEKMLACIADILRMQEDRVCATEPVLRQLLVILESDQSAELMLVALNGIEVSPEAPEVVVE